MLDGAVETLFDASDEEILAEARREYSEPGEAAEAVRRSLLEGVRSHRKKTLLLARKEYEQQLEVMRKHDHALPDTREGRLELLGLLLRRQPHLQQVVTVQFRDLDEVSDADVESLLGQLAELGVLDEI